MSIPIGYKNADWLLIIDDLDYIPAQPATFSEPSEPEELRLLKYHLKIHPDTVSAELARMINNQLKESSKLMDYFFTQYEDEIYAYALEHYHAEFDHSNYGDC